MSERSVDSAEDLVSPVTLTGSQNRLELAGNRTLLLDDPAAAWAVTGTAYVFAVPVEGGVSVGGREYVCAGRCGGALFGMSVGDVRVALLAVGRPGTLLERLDHDDERLHRRLGPRAVVGHRGIRHRVVEFGRPAHRHR